MNYAEKLENVSVLGAAGKMGRGILLLTAMEMVREKMQAQNKGRQFVLYAMDASNEALSELMAYVKKQAEKHAERNIVSLRSAYSAYAHLIDNKHVIDQYVNDVVSLIRPGTRIEPAFDSNVIFEAVSEKPDMKVDLLLTINRNSKKKPWFFTNTSAIPIAWLDDKAGLEGRIMGVHFYNPPPVQKLIEVVKTETTRPELAYFVNDFVRHLGKISVPAYDKPGFIGNGYFMRDILFAEKMVESLQQKDFSYIQAIYTVNRISQEFLLRPMGVFQLVDYVGIDVVQFIMSVINSYAKQKDVKSTLIDQFVDAGILGGQNPDGSQKNGIFSYHKGKIDEIYDHGKKRYLPAQEAISHSHSFTGELPGAWIPWKEMRQHPQKDQQLSLYFKELFAMETQGAKLAVQYLKNHRDIASKLVQEKIAFKFEDVNAVIINGFQHLYGPVNNFY